MPLHELRESEATLSEGSDGGGGGAPLEGLTPPEGRSPAAPRRLGGLQACPRRRPTENAWRMTDG